MSRPCTSCREAQGITPYSDYTRKFWLLIRDLDELIMEESELIVNIGVVVPDPLEANRRRQLPRVTIALVLAMRKRCVLAGLRVPKVTSAPKFRS